MTTIISTIYLREAATQKAVEAELRDKIDDDNLLDYQAHWQPAITEILKDLVRRGVARDQWPQSLHWNWQKKTAYVDGLLGYKSFSVTCAGMTQGLMLVDLTRAARQPASVGKPLVYVDYLEVAPWNWAELAHPKRYQGIGIALMTAAAQLSVDEGFKGRVGLHSLPQSEGFYRESCGMADVGPDAAYHGLKYFELTSEQAQLLVGKEEEDED